MSDAQNLCSACGADYVGAVVDDIAAGSKADPGLVLAGLEESLAGLESAPMPALGETARKMLPLLSGAALAFCLLSGMLAGAAVFYLLAFAALIVLAMSMRKRERLSAGEVVVRAAAQVFAEDAASVRERFADNAEAMARLDAIKLRIDDALAAQAAAHARNRKKVIRIAAVVLALCCAGVGALAVRNHAVRKAEAAYAAQPEWVKLRDRYLASADDDRDGDPELRLSAVHAMLDAGESAAAEEFFFAHSQGNIGDVDCALLIARHYKTNNDAEALGAFTKSVKLRYDSDTRKVKSLK